MPATTKDHNNNENQNSSNNGRKISTSTNTTTKPAEQGLKCPRCDSPNTKFCYFNNYSLTQPRHFCKTCRRYWTKGGALRNVPIGGGCRKNKKGMKPSSSSSSSSFSSRALSCGGDSRDSGGSTSDILQLGGLSKLLNGLSNPLDFNLGGLTFPASSSRLQQQQPQQFQLPIATGFYDYNNSNQFCSFGDGSASSSSGGFQLDPSSVVGGSSSNLIGLNFPAFPSSSSSGSGLFGGAIQQGLNSLNFHSNTLASSIESLSSLNQDLHWKLQQQRLGMLVGGDNQNQNQKEDNNNNNINSIHNSVLFSALNNNNNNNVNTTLENQTVVVQRPQPILFQSLEISKPLPSSSEIDVVGGVFPTTTTVGGGDSSCRREGTSDTTTAPTEWFFGNSYGSMAPTPTSTSSGGANNNNGHDNAGSNNWVGVGGVHAWADVQQPYTALP